MSTLSGGGKANEFTFQNGIINQLVANGWLVAKQGNNEQALNSELVMMWSKRRGPHGQ